MSNTKPSNGADTIESLRAEVEKLKQHWERSKEYALEECKWKLHDDGTFTDDPTGRIVGHLDTLSSQPSNHQVLAKLTVIAGLRDRARTAEAENEKLWKAVRGLAREVARMRPKGSTYIEGRGWFSDAEKKTTADILAEHGLEGGSND